MAMAAFLPLLLLLLLLVEAVVAVLPLHCLGIVAKKSFDHLTFDRDHGRSSQGLSFHGGLGQAAAGAGASLLPGDAQLTVWFTGKKGQALEHGAGYEVVGSLSVHSSSSPMPISGKSWNPRTHRPSSQRYSSTVQGDVAGVFNSTSRQLCSRVCLNRGKLRDCEAVLSLEFPLVRSIANMFVVGELQSLREPSDPQHFAPISIVANSRSSYNYTRLDDAQAVCDLHVGDAPPGVRTERDAVVCGMGLRNLQLDVSWNASCSHQVCHPFGDMGSNVSSWLRIMTFSRLACDQNGRVNGFLQLDEHGYRPWSYTGGRNSHALAVEGKWDSHSGQLCMVACQTNGSDCSIQITLQVPQSFSIHQRSVVIGHVASQRVNTDPLYFPKFSFKTGETRFTSYFAPIQSKAQYVYSKVEQAGEHCLLRNASQYYPDGSYFQDFWFHGSAKNKLVSKLVYVAPLTLGNRFSWVVEAARTSADMDAGIPKRHFKKLNASFDITTTTERWLPSDGSRIAAEGFYDPARGTLCMIGCQAVEEKHLSSQDLEEGKDCKVFIQIQYPPSSRNRSLSGSITSLRDKGDALYFEPLKVSSEQSMYVVEAKHSVWVRDLEVFMSMLTLSLVVIVLIFQLLHSKRHSKSRPYASLLMISVLVLGHVIPLVLNFEAVFANRSHHLRLPSTGGILEVNEVIIRLMNMAALLLLLWLLHLVWNSRYSSESAAEKTMIQEGRILLVCLPFYAVGAIVTSLAQWGLSKNLWAGLKAYSGLSLDLFMLPQVIANFVWEVEQVSALSPAFYVGMTVARIVPHVYDVFTRWKPSFNTGKDYYFADHDLDFFSLAWDVAITCVTVVVALVVFLQQKYGGRCFIPGSVRARYGKIPTAEAEVGMKIIENVSTSGSDIS